MSLSIIIDKSTFQSLSFNEIYRLSCYYKHIITPVLVMEILGDLKKETQEGSTPSQDRVIDFANKLFPVETVVSLHYKIQVINDLLGDPISFDGRPHVGIKKAVKSVSGEKGFLIEESEEEKSIYKWKTGKFSEADRELSALWRKSTTQADLLEQLKSSLMNRATPKFDDFNSLVAFVDASITATETQQLLLITLIQNYDIDALTGTKIFGRWCQCGNPLIKDFAPYAFHCLKVDALFLFGLTSGLIGTRPTNQVDMEYLYYLPFCNIFTSNDKVHKNLVPLLLLPYQRFIIGSDIKKDMNHIVTHIEGLEIEERKKFKGLPPLINSSLTFQLWKEFFDYPKQSYLDRDIPDEESSVMKKRMDEFINALDGESINLDSGEDADFIIKKSFISKNDPCVCGSGKRVIDCCIPEEKFNKLAYEEKMRQFNKGNS